MIDSTRLREAAKDFASLESLQREIDEAKQVRLAAVTSALDFIAARNDGAKMSRKLDQAFFEILMHERHKVDEAMFPEMALSPEEARERLRLRQSIDRAKNDVRLQHKVDPDRDPEIRAFIEASTLVYSIELAARHARARVPAKMAKRANDLPTFSEIAFTTEQRRSLLKWSDNIENGQMSLPTGAAGPPIANPFDSKVGIGALRIVLKAGDELSPTDRRLADRLVDRLQTPEAKILNDDLHVTTLVKNLGLHAVKSRECLGEEYDRLSGADARALAKRIIGMYRAQRHCASIEAILDNRDERLDRELADKPKRIIEQALQDGYITEDNKMYFFDRIDRRVRGDSFEPVMWPVHDRDLQRTLAENVVNDLAKAPNQDGRAPRGAANVNETSVLMLYPDGDHLFVAPNNVGEHHQAIAIGPVPKVVFQRTVGRAGAERERHIQGAIAELSAQIRQAIKVDARCKSKKPIAWVSDTPDFAREEPPVPGEPEKARYTEPNAVADRYRGIENRSRDKARAKLLAMAMQQSLLPSMVEERALKYIPQGRSNHGGRARG